MKLLSLSVATAALMTLPMSANAQLFGGFDNNSLLGGAIGAGLGGALGSNLAGSGVRDEGTAIGAVLGGLAGASFGNSRSRYAGNPYAGSFNPGFNGNNLLGSGIGAGIGGAIGSNLAGSGNRQEGTAIGAVLGGLAGYGIANARGNRGNGNFGGQGYGYAPAYGAPSYGAPSYGGGYTSPQHVGSQYYGPQHAGPQFMPSGQYVTSAVVPNITYQQAPIMQAPVMQARTRAYAPSMTIAAPNVRLAGPSLQRPDIYRGVTRVESMPIARAQRIVMPAPVQQSSQVTMSEPYTLSEPYVVSAPADPSYSQPNGYFPVGTAPAPAAPHVNYVPRSSTVNSGNNYGNSVHITSPSTGTGHYHGAYTGQTYCYAGSSKRYTAQGAEIIPNCSN